jgi:hypothetical protein
MARVILNRIELVLESQLRKEQAGFTKRQSCIDLINTLRIILQQSNEWKKTLYCTFVDSKKTFDSLAKDVIWHVMEEYKVPKKIVCMIRSPYEGFKSHVVHEGKLTDSFEVTTGVRLGCILSPTLFNLVLDNVMNKVIKGKTKGLQWKITERLEYLAFADDICLLTQRRSDIKAKLEKLQMDTPNVGLKINGFKTKENESQA